MEQSQHSLSELFRQLGLPADKRAIEKFITEHKPLEPSVKLSAAPFWSQSQSEFLKKAIMEDADWAPMVDQLNAELR
jgi:hypothetical protein